MFAKLAVCFLSLSALGGVTASPLNRRSWAKRTVETRNDAPPQNVPPQNNSEPISFDNWGGISSLDGFDSFNGRDNFDGSRNTQAIVVQQQQVVCRPQNAAIIQQQLAILQELAKRILTEQVCEVETQTIIFSQFHASLGTFRHDIQREGGRQPGFDGNVAHQIHQLVNADGSLNNIDFGFKGTDIGNQTIAPSGSNWDENKSPESVRQAMEAVKAAKPQRDASLEPQVHAPPQRDPALEP